MLELDETAQFTENASDRFLLNAYKDGYRIWYSLYPKPGRLPAQSLAKLIDKTVPYASK